MRFVTTGGRAPATTLEWAIFDGLAPDGSLYMPESIDRWTSEELAGLPSRSLVEIGVRVLRPYTADEIDEATLASIVRDALNFPIPLVEIEPGIHCLELFHGPTLAFKDVAARVMARLISALHDGGAPTSVLVATSGDTGSAVAHAFHGVPHTRVIVLYPDGRVSPRQEAQLTMFNGPDRATNVHAYAIAGSFDDCQRLVKAASSDTDLLRRVRLTSANSINIGRLLPQMVYYFHALAQLGSARGAGPSTGLGAGSSTALGTGPLTGLGASPSTGLGAGRVVVSTPSGNFGNLTAGLMAKRAGLPIARFVAATNVNDVVPAYLETGRFEPRASVRTLANAMDVGNPSNFDRMVWLYGGDLAAMRRDIAGSLHDDGEVRDTIRRVYEASGYLLDPHSAIGYRALKSFMASTSDGTSQSDVASRSPSDVASGFSRSRSDVASGLSRTTGGAAVFLATAHPAKFAEIVEPIIGHSIQQPASLREVLAGPRHIMRLDGTLEALRDRLMADD